MEAIMTPKTICVSLVATIALLADMPVLAQVGPQGLSARESDHHLDALGGTDWYVDDDNCPGPGSGTLADPFCSIQDGISAAMHGDTVVVMPGTYVEHIDFVGKAITVRSSAGPEQTVVEGTLSGPVVRFEGGEGRDSILEGLTITNGQSGQPGGGGIRCIEASPTIRRNLIVQNYVSNVEALGGGIYAFKSSAIIAHNTIRENAVSIVGMDGFASGGGIFAAQCTDFVIEGNVICMNSAWGFGFFTFVYGAGINLSGCTDALISNNLVVNNTAWAEGSGGSGMRISGGTVSIRNHTSAANMNGGVSGPGGDILLWDVSGSIVNSILWDDAALLCVYGGSTVEHSNVKGGWSGTGNIDADPLFVDAANGDFRLLPGSPCIDAGDPADLACGADVFGNPRRLDGLLDASAIVDMGACEFSHVRLAVSGTPTPGGTLDIDITGTLGLPALLFAGTQPGEACASHYGTLFFDPLQPWLLWPWGTLPSSVSVPIDPSVPTPLEVVLQAAALAPAVPASNTSNAVVLRIE
jgi:hypothetical protein